MAKVYDPAGTHPVKALILALYSHGIGSRWSCWVQMIEIRRLGDRNSWNVKVEVLQERLQAGLCRRGSWALWWTPLLWKDSLWLIKGHWGEQSASPGAWRGPNAKTIALTTTPKSKRGKPGLDLSWQGFHQHLSIKIICKKMKLPIITKFSMLENNPTKHKWPTQGCTDTNNTLSYNVLKQNKSKC